MKVDLLSRLPDWPARMPANIAALYMGVSHNTFLTRYRDKGIEEGGNVFWARAQLDRIIASQFSLPQLATGGEDRDDSWDDLR